jgi:glutamate-1-semialdehyde 2,1-aminomutase
VYQAGTLSGNPLATAAGLAALDLLDEQAYAQLETTAQRLADGIAKAFADAGLAALTPLESTLVGIYLGSDAPTDYVTAQRTDVSLYATFFHALLAEGVAIAPGAYEVLFPGLAHTDAVVDEVVAAVGRAARHAANGLR